MFKVIGNYQFEVIFKKLIITRNISEGYFFQEEFDEYIKYYDIESVSIKFSCLTDFDFRYLEKIKFIDVLTIFDSMDLSFCKNYIVCDNLKINTIKLENFDYNNILDILPLLKNPNLKSLIGKTRDDPHSINKYFRILKKKYLEYGCDNDLNFLVEYYGVIDNESSFDLVGLGKRFRDF